MAFFTETGKKTHIKIQIEPEESRISKAFLSKNKWMYHTFKFQYITKIHQSKQYGDRIKTHTQTNGTEQTAQI